LRVFAQGGVIKNQKQEKIQIANYVDKLVPQHMDGAWEPEGDIIDIHGDCKSSCGGLIRIKTMATSHGTYNIKLVKAWSKHKYDVMHNHDFDHQPTFEEIKQNLQDFVDGKYKDMRKKY